MKLTPKVFLIDDQVAISEAIQLMLPDTELLYCQNPHEAVQMANDFQPTVILIDLIMPEMDGLELIKQFRQNEETKKVPLIILSLKEEPLLKAKAFELGANDYLIKLPSSVELTARIHYHSNSYISSLQRDEAYDHLQRELNEAAKYVKQLLPKPLQNPQLDIKWHFHPSDSLGGDAFGYEWLDEDHLAIFLLDVCGHGVGAALFSISLMNIMLGQKLSHCDFYEPSSVLQALNIAYKMEAHNDMFFTFWYGVLDQKSGRLKYSSAGHPPALLFNGKKGAELLDTDGVAIGITEDANYITNETMLPPKSRLFIFSDGTFEVRRPDGSRMTFEDFAQVVEENQEIEKIFTSMKTLQNKETFDDDYSLLELTYRR